MRAPAMSLLPLSLSHAAPDDGSAGPMKFDLPRLEVKLSRVHRRLAPGASAHGHIDALRFVLVHVREGEGAVGPEFDWEGASTVDCVAFMRQMIQRQHREYMTGAEVGQNRKIIDLDLSQGPRLSLRNVNNPADQEIGIS